MKKTALLIIQVWSVAGPVGAQSPKRGLQPAGGPIGDRTITDAELEGLASNRLAKVKNEEYNIKRQVLDEYITRALIGPGGRRTWHHSRRAREARGRAEGHAGDGGPEACRSTSPDPQPYAGKSERKRSPSSTRI